MIDKIPKQLKYFFSDSCIVYFVSAVSNFLYFDKMIALNLTSIWSERSTCGILGFRVVDKALCLWQFKETAVQYLVGF